jgi:tryptophan synthase alpha chain
VSLESRDLLKDIRQTTDKPIGIGFGVSDGEQARQFKDWGADAVIVGSAFVKRLAAGREPGLRDIEQLCQELKQAIAVEESVAC